VARNARKLGLASKPWVKTSLAPGSRVVTDYLTAAGLLDELAGIGFNLVGYGCTTCIGNSGPLKPEISAAVKAGDVIGTSVLSGNRNFDGRVHPEVKQNYLASPPLVVAYALAGSLDVDLNNEPLGTGTGGKPVYLKDIWPTAQEVADNVHKFITSEMFKRSYAGADLLVGCQIHLREESALLRRHDDDAGREGQHRGRTRAGPVRRFHHDRSHLAGRQHRQEQPGREIPHGTGRAAGRLQPVRRAAWQP
jgi:aconitase A